MLGVQRNRQFVRSHFTLLKNFLRKQTHFLWSNQNLLNDLFFVVKKSIKMIIFRKSVLLSVVSRPSSRVRVRIGSASDAKSPSGSRRKGELHAHGQRK